MSEKNPICGQFYPWFSGKELAEIEDTRPVVISYKQSAAMKSKGIEARASVYTLVPTAHLTLDTVKQQIDQLAPLLLSYLQEQEDLIVREYHKKEGTTFYTDKLSIPYIVEEMEKKGISALNGEVISSWFENDIVPRMLEEISSKHHLNNDLLSKLQVKFQGIMKKFISLASAKTKITAQERKALSTYFRYAQEHPVTHQLQGKFEAMERAEEEALNALGFDIDSLF